MISPKIIVALDYPNEAQAIRLANQLDPKRCSLKVGSILFTQSGPSLIKTLVDLGFNVFLDLKFHDIPNTVVNACLAAADLGVWMVNIHCMGGRKMLSACAEAYAKQQSKMPILLGVTVLTSFNQSDLNELGISQPLPSQVSYLAKLAKDCGLDGVVSSAHEVSTLRDVCGENFCLVTPGIRLAHDSKHDQKRTMTPSAALASGADYLVIGRSITQALNPVSVLDAIEIDILQISMS